ncbi:PP2C family protein-serine/threonine phosphatase [Streptomyces sp. Z26]|uniref:PP2C family protein-serine/threonine phosphatase n=1 Tax=Streptomyces sp. Z26 TaxID=2500177 RepID=UPI000EF15FF5|nr:PP2C family protein-serine/threonine phosphatase [Streptomyces sp. Z26]RLL66087.1 serine/threonine-protein phosphatase [Streptomyces sp. Z26]
MSGYDARTGSLAELRDAVRRVADAHQLPLRTRARLTTSVAMLARARMADGGTVELRARREPEALEVTLAAPCAGDADGSADADAPDPAGVRDVPDAAELPLPARVGDDGEVLWRITVPAAAASASPAPVSGDDAVGGTDAPPDEPPAEAELRATLAELDTLRAAHRRLNDELAATNSGVLALYVQLEERDEQLRRAHGKMLRELEDALRPPPLHVPGLELAVHYAPAEPDAPTGGDLYDWFTLPDGTVHITVVDALGHGVKSTRSAMNVTHAVRTLALEGHRPEDIVRRADEILNGIDPDLMATVLLVRLDPATGDVRLANGSHPPVLVVRRDGDAAYLEAPGRGIGFPYPGSEKVVSTRLDPGDLLVAYTDGLTESHRDPLEGERRLHEAARRERGRPTAELPGRLAELMHTEVLHHDDTLALAVRLDAGTP